MEWISIKENIPENQRFIILGNHYAHPDDPKQAYIAAIRDDKWYSLGSKIVNVTHYMPLPEPPSK